MEPPMFRAVLAPLYHGFLSALPAEAALQLQFLKVHGRIGNFRNPETFSEKVQWRKLSDRDPRFVEWSDKVRVKSIVADIIGSDWIIPTLWSGAVLPPMQERTWPLPFALKANHTSGRNYFVRGPEDLDWARLEALAQQWMRQDWKRHLHEDYYNHIQRSLLIEPLIRGYPLNDYKFFCFSGRARYIQVDTDRFGDHKRCFYDTSWNKQTFGLGFRFETADVEPPAHLHDMVRAAERLSEGFDFVRIDLYDRPEHPLFGEATFLPGSGFERFSDAEIDRELGDLWTLPQKLSQAA